jgi:hypothetical protein
VVIIGTSIAGLCAARVPSAFYDLVTLFKHELPSTSANRTAISRSGHMRMVTASPRCDESDALFPGLLEDVTPAGMPMLKKPT